MKLPAFQCCVCSRTVVATDGVMFRIKYNPPEVGGHDGFEPVDEWHSGVRCVCGWCVAGFLNCYKGKVYG
jgi:hypothetical protein